MKTIYKWLIIFVIMLIVCLIIDFVFNNSPYSNWIGGMIAGMIGIKILENE